MVISDEFNIVNCPLYNMYKCGRLDNIKCKTQRVRKGIANQNITLY